MSLFTQKVKPINSVLVVNKKCINNVPPDQVDVSLIGVKGYGLATLPTPWTLPFFVISVELVESARKIGASGALDSHLPKIIEAMDTLSLKDEDRVHIRSSGIAESLLESGRFLTNEEIICSDIRKVLLKFIQVILDDKEFESDQIAIIIQKSAISSHKGHLSNERRCSKEDRDWLGQFESKAVNQDLNINLRNWREKIDPNEHTSKPLACKLEVNIKRVLSYVAAWGKTQPARIHLEWVWDGSFIYIVQANEEKDTGSYAPDEASINTKQTCVNFSPKSVKPIDSRHARKYNKIKNVHTYMQIGLPSIPLYILDDRSILIKLSKDQLDPNLKSDLEALTSHSLVIRTDINSTDQHERQMLLRTDEFRSFKDASEWLFKSSRELLKSYPNTDIAFIFHNFIPAQSSAFALAAPGERKVQIEGLWGIPEGLYYYPHDKIIVDTKNANLNIASSSLSTFDIKKNSHYKSFCVAPDLSGKWITQKIKPPYDWRCSINNEEWIKEIAINSRKIAEAEGESVSIMWFINIPDWVTTSKIIPWFHEPYSLEHQPKPEKPSRPKTPFDKHITIKNSTDIQKLEAAISDKTNIRQILIQPTEEKLLRDKDTLRKIGQLAIRAKATLLLEGATLSHAFYQLQKTGATVTVTYPFQKDEDIREFNKLVRDRIPENIQRAGEKVQTKELIGNELTRALREKLVEEAIEVLDAADQDAILDEIADVLEVVDGLVTHLNAKKSDIEDRKSRKLRKAGGFERGLILLETSNPLPSRTTEALPSLNLHFDPEITATPPPKSAHQSLIKKKTDQRIHTSATESLLTLEIPLLLEKWEAESREVMLSGKGKPAMKVLIKGHRDGTKAKLEISIFTTPNQPDLWD